MKTAWTEDAWQDYWQQEDEKVLTSINDLIKDIKRDPFKGSGNRSPSNMPCRGGGLAASQASTVWSIACPARVRISSSISFNAAITIDPTAMSPSTRRRFASPSPGGVETSEARSWVDANEMSGGVG